MMLPSFLQLCRVSDNCQQARVQVQDLFSSAKQLTDKKVTHISTAPSTSYFAFSIHKDFTACHRQISLIKEANDFMYRISSVSNNLSEY